jgi:hypothetical protein
MARTILKYMIDNERLSDRLDNTIGVRGDVVERSAIPSDDANLQLLVEQGILIPVETPVEAEAERARSARRSSGVEVSDGAS